MSAPTIHGPLLMTVRQFADLHGIGETTVRECIAGTSKSYPPLTVKRVKRKGSRTPGRLYITAEQAAAWRAALQDA
ncbi:MAG TPA: hypothetical protein VK053_22050 [Jiangellaceae bacterium]|nr:hypothetical protein [Jiangellaceae bacterium]